MIDPGSKDERATLSLYTPRECCVQPTFSGGGSPQHSGNQGFGQQERKAAIASLLCANHRLVGELLFAI